MSSSDNTSTATVCPPIVIPQWKKELIARLHKNKCLLGGTASQPDHPSVPGAMVQLEQPTATDDEDLKYGPGIVNKLRNKYLSLALRAECVRPTFLRKSASLENILDEPGLQPVKTARNSGRNAVRGTHQAAQRARSVETISRGKDVHDSRARNTPQIIEVPPVKARPPKRIQPLVNEKEKPPQHLVKNAKMIFERRPEHRTRAPHHTGEVAAKVATYKNIIKASSKKPPIKVKPNLYAPRTVKSPSPSPTITSPIPDISSSHGDGHHVTNNGLCDTPDLIKISCPGNGINNTSTPNFRIVATEAFLREERSIVRTPSPIESKVEERRHFFEEAASHSPKSKKTFQFPLHKNSNNYRSYSPVSPPPRRLQSDLDAKTNNEDLENTAKSEDSSNGDSLSKEIVAAEDDRKRPSTITRRKNVSARPKDLNHRDKDEVDKLADVKTASPKSPISDDEHIPNQSPNIAPDLGPTSPRPTAEDDVQDKTPQHVSPNVSEHLDPAPTDDDVHPPNKRITAESQENLAKQASNSVTFNFVQNQNVLATSTPPTQPLQVEVNGFGGKVNGQLSAIELKKNSKNAKTELVTADPVHNKLENSKVAPPPPVLKVKKASPSRNQVENNSVVFKFTDRKDVPDYVQNDGSRRAAKIEKPKVGEGGIILLPGASIGESFTEDDEDEEAMRSLEGPPSPCDVTFINDNILIDGKSSLSQKTTKKSKMKLSFVEAFPEIFEYPSEASLLIETEPEKSPTHAQLGHQVPSMSGTSSLAHYTPKTTEDFQPGITRNIPRIETTKDAEKVEENHEISQPPMLFSSGTNSDILF